MYVDDADNDGLECTCVVEESGEDAREVNKTRSVVYTHMRNSTKYFIVWNHLVLSCADHHARKASKPMSPSAEISVFSSSAWVVQQQNNNIMTKLVAAKVVVKLWQGA